ncbi:hypothetical protein, partial [Vibrio anguillarum]|uniref:hypothetical protein n=1 Tax=Vibrio anguillarum TaxID=55601 RepID=UPI001EE67893
PSILRARMALASSLLETRLREDMSAPECIKRIQINGNGLKIARLFSQSTFLTANVLLEK